MYLHYLADTYVAVKTLDLVLKKKWFDMIKSGEKKEEYRDITNYWCVRLCNNKENFLDGFKDFEAVRFRHGYGKDAPYIVMKCEGIEFGEGRPEWGGGFKECFVIKLGHIIKTSE